jgi:hypothetical protein
MTTVALRKGVVAVGWVRFTTTTTDRDCPESPDPTCSKTTSPMLPPPLPPPLTVAARSPGHETIRQPPSNGASCTEMLVETVERMPASPLTNAVPTKELSGINV